MAASGYRLLRSEAGGRNRNEIRARYRYTGIKGGGAHKNKEVRMVSIGCKADGTIKEQPCKGKIRVTTHIAYLGLEV